jgi:shikimate kinase
MNDIDIDKLITLIDRPIALVGLMGSGKTTVGRRLSYKLNLPFIDTDEEVIKSAGCSITDIFKYAGENYFVETEYKVFESLTKYAPIVISTGGGSFIHPEIRALIKKNFLSIWLKADLEIAVERVSRRNTRPMLEEGDKKEIMKKLMDERYPLYSEADITVSSGDTTHMVIVDRIMTQLSNYYSCKKT